MSNKKQIYKVEIECDNESWRFVQTLKHLRSHGYNTASMLANALNALGAPLPTNAVAWTPDAVRKVLQRLKLIGLDNGKLRPADGLFSHARRGRSKDSVDHKSKPDMTVYCRL
jgi:hypothetical protein